MPSILRDFVSFRFVNLAIVLLAYILWVVLLIFCFTQNDNVDEEMTGSVSSYHAMPRPLALYAWTIGQWCYWISPQLSELFTKNAWRSLEQISSRQTTTTGSNQMPLLDIPTIDIQQFIGNETGALQFLQHEYGKDWIQRPLHLKGLWAQALLQSSERQLSPKGLLQMNLTIPYFVDSRVYGALNPDAEGSVNEIVRQMLDGHPHKIGSQLIVQENPQLLVEVAPLSLVTALFGDYFSMNHLLGHGKTLGIFPGITTVPLFVANGKATRTNHHQQQEEEVADHETSNQTDEDASCSKDDGRQSFENRTIPSTGLHCEPIANVAVQLSGFRRWTLVDPKYSWMLRPALSRDGRSFFPSWVTSLDHVPRYELITNPGDAVFVPTWTWHRVDYMKESEDLSIGASLFHFRVWDYIMRNPLFAVLIIPSLIGELGGIRSQ
ncbi:cupin-like domain containing protein [Nitzschia inconspicua]|uniref:Cupin-like domain containing protein n=1 Tax=Nitzschia inconspicua TaxID=303405 RepID=A0A9K3L295_9STRA|nr:cupin-like domain containing protein [Nitzschia inconspicua]